MIRALLAVAAVLAGAGCAGSPSTESTSSASGSTKATSREPTSAAKGERISGTGYIYRVPKGWGRPPQDPPGFDLDSLAVNLRDNDGFTDNVNVLLSPVGVMTPERAEDAAENELTAAGAKDISVNDRITVAGSETAHLTAVGSINDRGYRIEQFYPTDNDQTFIVTFSFSTSVTVGDRAKVTDPLLASWAWTD
jgi:hypothetical protein